MKRLCLAILALMVCFSTAAFAEDSGIRFSDFNGEVTVRPEIDEDAWDMAELDMILNVDDHVKTGEESTAILGLTDMTTFVMKPECEIILSSPPEKDNKIKLLAGKVWVNVKKMVKDGTLDVEMSQAVAGIKGTNITCSSTQDGSENRVRVLRGVARVLIKETKEEVDVKMGEELVIKTGGKTEKFEIDIKQIQELWEEETSRLGESIQLNEVPETIQRIIEMESTEFAKISEEFQKIIAMETIDPLAVDILLVDAERFIGVLLEDGLILASSKKKISDALATPNISDSDKVKLMGMLKSVNEANSKREGFATEIDKIMRYQFKTSMFESVTEEVEMLANEVNDSVAEIEGIQAEVAASPAGLSQDWFKEAQDTCQDTISNLDEQAEKAELLVEKNPEDRTAQNLVKSIADQKDSIADLMKDLQVVEISSSDMTQILDLDDQISDQLVELEAAISNYNSSFRAQTRAAQETQLKVSIQILGNFAKVRRNYTKAQRLYDKTMRLTATSKFRTSEQDEFENTWMSISDRFQQLGIVAHELQSNIEDLEEQLNTYLK